MLERILIPLDGSELSQRVLVHVRRLLLREDAEVELLHVIPPHFAEDAKGERAKQAEKAADRQLRGIEEDLNRRGATAAFTIRKGDAAEEIVRHARRTKASLIAMSTHGRSGLSRWLRGSVAERVLRESDVPLLMANPGVAEEMGEGTKELSFEKIVVPLDGSELAAKVLPLVSAFARLYDSKILILHSPPMYTASMIYPEWEVPAPPHDPAVLVAPYVKKLENQGLPVSVRTGVGIAAADILEAVEDEKADLVAMTTHGRTGLSRWVFGSVAEKVLRHCPVPMLVMRTAAFQK